MLYTQLLSFFVIFGVVGQLFVAVPDFCNIFYFCIILQKYNKEIIIMIIIIIIIIIIDYLSLSISIFNLSI